MAQGELEVWNARNTVAVCLGAVGSAAESARGPATVLTLDDTIGSALALAAGGARPRSHTSPRQRPGIRVPKSMRAESPIQPDTIGTGFQPSLSGGLRRSWGVAPGWNDAEPLALG